MISVDEALSHLFSLVAPLEAESAPLQDACGRVLAETVTARRDQPPFSASAMDGYAVQSSDAVPGARLSVIGEAAAGHGFAGGLSQGQAVRIFTGAPVPDGADRVVIQEDVAREGNTITLGDQLDEGPHIRRKGTDFSVGDAMKAPRRLTPSDVALLAAMNIPRVMVARKPVVALISTGDELVMPGEDPGPDQIIASNTFGLKAMLEEMGATARLLPIARDNTASLETAFDLAEGADLVVTIGGASVGDHDMVGDVAASLGMERSFYKVRMRPGKPLMAGRMGQAAMVGLPGNPVSAMVCGHVFLAPMIRLMLGLGEAPAPRRSARLAQDIDKGGPREHYMRATVADGTILAEDRQDSSLLSVLARANALMIRPPDDAPRAKGETIEYIPI
ncbi:gephyrin-like molybdotransferase Glp [Roseovarius indicus]|uniref:Molybdopterin molybdenumtransferase n=1 Tax=Roseovarius indicus TaxID=540747 RepID=A0A0T5P813_9RHOB|nr:gephyrin-like molybdotransferase Glp [Roseovarius indicus]KRS17474.1 molybdenum cofactor biosynthesis protein MoaA [Roseovarius indicus]QEW26664.1 Molybdopterin molybdenumtransferase [Roseovarius indicus]SFD61993.1 molybdopterin molybdotransferase [Roseovarius indicus]